MTCPKGHKKVLLVEYSYGDPYRYDGVSEISCKTCEKRYGRWSSKVLRGKEQEPPLGNQKYITRKSVRYK